MLEESTLVDDDTGIIPHRQRELREKSKEKNPSVTHKQRVGEEFIVTLTAHFDKHVLTEDWLTWLDSVQLITLSQAPDRAVRWCGTVTTYISPIHRQVLKYLLSVIHRSFRVYVWSFFFIFIYTLIQHTYLLKP